MKSELQLGKDKEEKEERLIKYLRLMASDELQIERYTVKFSITVL